MSEEESWRRMQRDASLPDVLLRDETADGGRDGWGQVEDVTVGSSRVFEVLDVGEQNAENEPKNGQSNSSSNDVGYGESTVLCRVLFKEQVQ